MDWMRELLNINETQHLDVWIQNFENYLID